MANEDTEVEYCLKLKTELTIIRNKDIQTMDIYKETTGLNVHKKVLHSCCGYMKEGHQGGDPRCHLYARMSG